LILVFKKMLTIKNDSKLPLYEKKEVNENDDFEQIWLKVLCELVFFGAVSLKDASPKENICCLQSKVYNASHELSIRQLLFFKYLIRNVSLVITSKSIFKLWFMISKVLALYFNTNYIFIFYQNNVKFIDRLRNKNWILISSFISVANQSLMYTHVK